MFELWKLCVSSLDTERGPNNGVGRAQFLLGFLAGFLRGVRILVFYALPSSLPLFFAALHCLLDTRSPSTKVLLNSRVVQP
jgi:hypothetical protein